MTPVAHLRDGRRRSLCPGPTDTDLSASVPLTSIAWRGTPPWPRGVRMLERSIRFPRTAPSCNLHEILHSTAEGQRRPYAHAYATTTTGEPMRTPRQPSQHTTNGQN